MRLILVTTIVATTMSLGLAVGLADSQCSRILPVPATVQDISCAISNGPSPRCANGMPPHVCETFRLDALNRGLLTFDAFTWLQAIGWCPIVFDDGNGPRIFELCPLV